MNKTIIASVSLNGIIGRDGTIPWKSEVDLKHFRQTTLDHPVIMGRKTFESIGRALDRRTNIVLTRDINSELKKITGIILCHSLPDAYDFCRKEGYEQIYIIGGAAVFSQTINSADELLISRMDLHADGDAEFPAVDENIWQLQSLNKYDDFELQKYVKAV